MAAGRWYLLAGTGDGQRTFRVDRIADAVVTDQPAERPADFALAAAWGRVVEEVERRRAGSRRPCWWTPRFLPVLRAQFGRHCEVWGHLDDGRVRVRVAAPIARTIAEQLAGWGRDVEVVEPESVRVELRRIGVELAERYAGRQGERRRLS